MRANTHTAPNRPSSAGPPTAKVWPSADKATDVPWAAGPLAPVPTSLGPC
ncbi:hypothetical protein MUN81_22605 (plasmid) [Hymenobacter sp. 5317J-9]|nr:hypothetical protein [Hymenobacter sp. 5317J-9]UOR00231.1 hypothetical protein MUN81_22605 [Hymenobacter sp. 5317J-9]